MISTMPTTISVGEVTLLAVGEQVSESADADEAPTLTRLMLDTAAIRRPGDHDGGGDGKLNRTSRRQVPKPIATAACLTGSGTERSPSTTLGNSTASE